MDEAGQQKFRERLAARLTDLAEGEALGRDGKKVVTLDQQAVGRLSRMDALQSQAMAQAASRLRSAEERRVRAALARLDEGEFGYCTDCGEEIAPARLDQDPSVALCISCARG
ncbi:TraR/DksA C4-type zinc finger protein [Oceanicola sp. 502str15]|uniref:TraR/DksA family transcriptional regulator n=1 Tax=Oceanicola sp. 502str15 TaxID=2696061 RepID=UPI002095A389|nr:TraR/DksA C4-type zinc finger protein [Oceanicola sp. 502str15]MCO6381893.1 TraR/DksA family transcriptional regulator [Oceanicola sp. 502str15]